MRCLGCEITVEDFWWWCPDCGGKVAPDPLIDLRPVKTEYVVEWAVAGNLADRGLWR
jgi:hypothetical protein